MSYSFTLQEVLEQYNGALYKMIRLKLINNDRKFYNTGASIRLVIDDGINKANMFMYNISANQKELDAYFVTDAFENFENNSSIFFSYGVLPQEEITGLDVNTLAALSSQLSSLDFTDADSQWLADIV